MSNTRIGIALGFFFLWAASGVSVQALTCDVNADGRVDRSDIEIISKNLNNPAAGNLLDADVNRNGVIDVLDGRQCVVRWCTYGSCDPTNHPPQANAGPDQTVPRTGEVVTLDGSLSSDPDPNTELLCEWSLIAPPDSGATLSDPSAVKPTFILDLPGTYTAKLTCSDGMLTGEDTVTISTGPVPPVADAGPDQTARPGQTVTLEGTGYTYVVGAKLTYQWSLTDKIPEGSNARNTLVHLAPEDPKATFVVDLPGTYEAQLIVNDGTFSSLPDRVIISTIGSRPVANAGTNQTVHPVQTVTLDGSKSTDVDGDELTYRWSLIRVPAGSRAFLSHPFLENPRATFVVDVVGEYVAQLIVNDGTSGDSKPAMVTINGVDSPPECNPTWQLEPGICSPDFLNQMVTLTANCQDSDKDPLTYQWSLTTIPDGSNARNTLVHLAPEDPKATFQVDLPGTYVAQLIANDGFQDSRPATATIDTVNNRPVADAGDDQTLDLLIGTSRRIALDGSGSSDIDCDPLTYRWSMISRPAGSQAILSDPTAVNPRFDADVPGTYVAQLIVNDGTFDSEPPDTVTVIVNEVEPPSLEVNMATESLTVQEGNSINVKIFIGIQSLTRQFESLGFSVGSISWTIQFIYEGTATPGSDFTLGSFDVINDQGLIPFNAMPDELNEGSEIVTIQAGASSGTASLTNPQGETFSVDFQVVPGNGATTVNIVDPPIILR